MAAMVAPWSAVLAPATVGRLLGFHARRSRGGSPDVRAEGSRVLALLEVDARGHSSRWCGDGMLGPTSCTICTPVSPFPLVGGCVPPLMKKMMREMPMGGFIRAVAATPCLLRAFDWVNARGRRRSVPAVGARGLPCATGVHARHSPGAGEGDVRARLRSLNVCFACAAASRAPPPFVLSSSSVTLVLLLSSSSTKSPRSTPVAMAIACPRPAYQVPPNRNVYSMLGVTMQFMQVETSNPRQRLAVQANQALPTRLQSGGRRYRRGVTTTPGVSAPKGIPSESVVSFPISFKASTLHPSVTTAFPETVTMLQMLMTEVMKGDAVCPQAVVSNDNVASPGEASPPGGRGRRRHRRVPATGLDESTGDAVAGECVLHRGGAARSGAL